MNSRRLSHVSSCNVVEVGVDSGKTPPTYSAMRNNSFEVSTVAAKSKQEKCDLGSAL